MMPSQVEVLPQTVVVIGAGASGALVCAHLLAQFAQRASVMPQDPVQLGQVHWIGQHRPFGLGLAYGTSEIAHLLNVRAKGMSAFSNQPLHFLNWFRSAHPEMTANESSFLPRCYYGEYLMQLLPENEPQIHRHFGEVVSIEPQKNRYLIRIKTSEGEEQIIADQVVLALGNLPGPRPFGAISPDQIGSVRKNEKILLLGTGLTMIDTVLSLKKREQRTPITAISRRGLVSRAHSVYSGYSPSLKFMRLFSQSPTSLVELVREFRSECRLASQQGSDWRAVFDHARPLTQSLWMGLRARDKIRFIRHIRPYWDVHRHRVAPEIDKTIRDMQERGELVVRNQRITPELLSGFDVVVDCMGFNYPIKNGPQSLIQSLMTNRLVKIDDPPISFHQSPEHPHIHIIGPLLRGLLWESTAIPEIRVQAETIAELISSERRSIDPDRS